MKLPKNFHLTDFDSGGHRNLGVFFYGREILFGWEKDFGIRSYQFKFRITNADSRDIILGTTKNVIQEDISFIFTCNLQDYTKEVLLMDLKAENPWKAPKKKRLVFDDEKLVVAAASEYYKKAIGRINRKITNIVPKPAFYTATNWHKNDEFLEFTKETADCWAGPFEQKGKLGACVSLHERPEALIPPVLDARTQWSYYLFCQTVKVRLNKQAQDLNDPKIPNGDHLTYHWNAEQKGAFFDSLSESEKYHIIQRFYVEHFRYVKENGPYSLYLCGNDDCSYTKYFSTKQEAKDELKYLRMMQPLDFELDISKRNYIFTN